MNSEAPSFCFAAPALDTAEKGSAINSGRRAFISLMRRS